MSTVVCPNCKLTLTGNEVSGGKCPVCKLPIGWSKAKSSPAFQKSSNAIPAMPGAACPHCGRFAFSNTDLLGMSPRHHRPCRVCQKPVAVSRRSHFGMFLVMILPVLLLLGFLAVFGGLLPRRGVPGISLVAGIGVLSWMRFVMRRYWKHVELVCA
jgi:hypothetical protein